MAVSRKNLIIAFMSLELMSLGVNITLVHFSVYFDDIIGQVVVFFMLAISAVESAVGLCLFVSYNMLATRNIDALQQRNQLVEKDETIVQQSDKSSNQDIESIMGVHMIEPENKHKKSSNDMPNSS